MCGCPSISARACSKRGRQGPHGRRHALPAPALRGMSSGHPRLLPSSAPPQRPRHNNPAPLPSHVTHHQTAPPPAPPFPSIVTVVPHDLLTISSFCNPPCLSAPYPGRIPQPRQPRGSPGPPPPSSPSRGPAPAPDHAGPAGEHPVDARPHRPPHAATILEGVPGLWVEHRHRHAPHPSGMAV